MDEWEPLPLLWRCGNSSSSVSGSRAWQDIARHVIGCHLTQESRHVGSKHVSMTWRAMSKERGYMREEEEAEEEEGEEK